MKKKLKGSFFVVKLYINKKKKVNISRNYTFFHWEYFIFTKLLYNIRAV